MLQQSLSNVIIARTSTTMKCSGHQSCAMYQLPAKIIVTHTPG